MSLSPNRKTQTPDNIPLGTPVCYLSPRGEAKLVNLIGKRCIVQCQLDGMPVEALWDTGAQACIINDQWRKRNLPHHTVRPLAEPIKSETLIGLAANHTQIPFRGWVEVEFRLGQGQTSGEPLVVPILVSSDSKVAEQPIIGFNVIEEVVSGAETQQQKAEIIQKICGAFSVTVRTARSMVKLIQAS